MKQVYWNSRKKCFSIRDKKSRLVEDHVHSLIMKNVKFKVSEAGRARARRDRVKNVHAWIESDDIAVGPLGIVPADITYSPWAEEPYFTWDGERARDGIDLMMVETDGKPHITQLSRGEVVQV